MAEELNEKGLRCQKTRSKAGERASTDSLFPHFGLDSIFPSLDSLGQMPQKNFAPPEYAANPIYCLIHH